MYNCLRVFYFDALGLITATRSIRNECSLKKIIFISCIKQFIYKTLKYLIELFTISSFQTILYNKRYFRLGCAAYEQEWQFKWWERQISSSWGYLWRTDRTWRVSSGPPRHPSGSLRVSSKHLPVWGKTGSPLCGIWGRRINTIRTAPPAGKMSLLRNWSCKWVGLHSHFENILFWEEIPFKISHIFRKRDSIPSHKF